jgi:hypothetical protein
MFLHVPSIAPKLYIADTCKGCRMKDSSSFQRRESACLLTLGTVVDTLNKCPLSPLILLLSLHSSSSSYLLPTPLLLASIPFTPSPLSSLFPLPSLHSSLSSLLLSTPPYPLIYSPLLSHSLPLLSLHSSLSSITSLLPLLFTTLHSSLSSYLLSTPLPLHSLSSFTTLPPSSQHINAQSNISTLQLLRS